MNKNTVPESISAWRAVLLQARAWIKQLPLLNSNSTKQRMDTAAEIKSYFQYLTLEASQQVHALSQLQDVLVNPPYEDTLGLNNLTDLRDAYGKLTIEIACLKGTMSHHASGRQPKNYIEGALREHFDNFQRVSDILDRILEKTPAKE